MKGSIGFQLGVEHAREQLRGRFGRATVLLAAAWVLLTASVERSSGGPAATNALLGPLFGVAVPILCLSTVLRVTGGSNFRALLASSAVLGANRRAVVCGIFYVVAASLGVLSCALSLFTLLLTRSYDQALILDAFTTSWISLLGAACYTSMLLGALCLTTRGIGVFLCLGLDWLLGSSSNWAAQIWPRTHLYSLLGGSDNGGLPASYNSLALLALALFWGALLLRRAGR